MLKLVCRDDTTLIVRVSEDTGESNAENDSSDQSITQHKFDGRLFIIKVQEGDDVKQIVYIVSYLDLLLFTTYN